MRSVGRLLVTFFLRNVTHFLLPDIYISVSSYVFPAAVGLVRSMVDILSMEHLMLFPIFYFIPIYYLISSVVVENEFDVYFRLVKPYTCPFISSLLPSDFFAIVFLIDP